ncbi:MAG: hypothetical protein CVU19_03065 [Betaproteobacteria bacterium HGW-Betaproteobacteria-13]|jgi:hypothetical protein|uniref:Uncharacterized protein n=1 Tax=Parazoarcus communis TaxID=41977 RepID=A0A2U8H296_9RHOO|nr:hypothetical protein [Parazoarcus communis]AWI80099.1 hypothetical protein CEW87_12400 [Parazoarcus communis]PKO57517.1 MAG: hypothetical protein CVU25_07760 [Betaproteobacteria bacterium HGW-Betaproteobacteria-19]PKO82191.1 MAG: hypothetical protein CVU19_03065 [Betaproteobacteria bacterium HGW-Betaproteobacteria-13]
MNRSLVVLLSATALLAGGCVSNPLKPAEQAADKPAAASTTADGKDYRTVKSRDGSFDGEIWGKPAKNSKFTSLQIGMSQSEVEDKIGRSSDMKSYVTGKAWIPFYFGTDGHRFETYYKGQGSLIYTGGGIGGGRGVLIGINHDATEDGYQ